MAAAVTSGVVALVIEASRQETDSSGWWQDRQGSAVPPLAPNAVKAVLQFAALRLADDGGNVVRLPHARGRRRSTLAAPPSWPPPSTPRRRRDRCGSPTGSPQSPPSGANRWPGHRTSCGARSRSRVDAVRQPALLDDEHRLGHASARQHRVGHGDRTTTSSGARPRRQHRLGHGADGDNIVWGTGDGDNIVWGTARRQHRVGHRATTSCGRDNIVWGTADNIVWGTARRQHRVGHATSSGRQHRVGTSAADDNIVWGTVARPTTSSGARVGATTTSCGAQPTTSSGEPSQRAAEDCDGEHAVSAGDASARCAGNLAGGPLEVGDHRLARRRCRVLAGTRVTLRELRTSDAPSLLAMLTTEEVTRFISPPPTDGRRASSGSSSGLSASGPRARYACFAVVPARDGRRHRALPGRGSSSPGFATAEWGFAIGSPFWGNGMFPEAPARCLAFVFDRVGVHRLEARAAVPNGRGNGALQEARCRPGRRPAQVVPALRRVPRPGVVVDHRG